MDPAAGLGFDLGVSLTLNRFNDPLNLRAVGLANKNPAEGLARSTFATETKKWGAFSAPQTEATEAIRE